VAIEEQPGECVALAALHGLEAEVAALEQTVHDLASELGTVATPVPADQAATCGGRLRRG